MTAAERPSTTLQNATAPPERRGLARDAVRMLVTDRGAGTRTHARFSDLPAFLKAGDVLVVNDSATIPAAIDARRANGETIKLHVATRIDSRLRLTEPRSPAVVLGEELALPGGGSAALIAPVDPDRARVWYTWFQLPLPMYEYLSRYGEPIRYEYVAERYPLEDYQTIFAREPGSSEMASAARPFTSRVVRAVRAHGVDIATVTLHCGVSSFEDPELPSMERFTVPPETARIVNRARSEGRRIIAVGTTALRALESTARDSEILPASGWTDLVIGEAHRVRIADGLLTGFHDSAATHQWILRAFLEAALLSETYAEAAECGYLQHEFGDIHLIV